MDYLYYYDVMTKYNLNEIISMHFIEEDVAKFGKTPTQPFNIQQCDDVVENLQKYKKERHLKLLKLPLSKSSIIVNLYKKAKLGKILLPVNNLRKAINFLTHF